MGLARMIVYLMFTIFLCGLSGKVAIYCYREYKATNESYFLAFSAFYYIMMAVQTVLFFV